ncbi:unnamed protein product [Durusdinium trenchii]|uniref:F5/8 type C domain-containing protein n=1 Tax=Durusdinium trenchii TaxID=1381693 RepID=A0ABP0S356_9DINO
MQFRGGLAAQFKVTGFSFRGTNGRPSRASSDALAEAWINEMDPATAQEYLSLEELPEGEESDGQAEAPTGQTEPDVVSQLQARIIQLEGLLQNANQPNPRVLRSVCEPKAQSGAPAPKAPGLFQGAQSSQLTPQDWARLQSLAGSPPPRVAGVERRRPDPPAVQKLQENLYADLEKEAVEDEVSLALKPLEGQLNESSLDPMQQMVLAQLRQNQLLLQKLIGNKPQDPVMRVLGSSGSDSGGGSSGGGVKGCLAREAFIHAIQDLPEVSRVVRRAALRELGLSSDREDGNLMRKYMERRIPLADHRLLAQFAGLISEGWAVGYEAGNEQMLGTLGRMMIFVEQCALDSGNLAYLKDLDYIEGRMNSIGKNPKGGDGRAASASTQGTSVAAFSASYPLRVVHQMASGSLAARAGIVESMPVAAQVRSLYEVGVLRGSGATYLYHQTEDLAWDLNFQGVSLRSHLLLSPPAQLVAVASKEGGPFVACGALSRLNRWTCGTSGITLDARSAFHGGALPGGTAAAWRAQRWRFRFSAAVPAAVLVSAWLPNALVEGHVDGSPIVSRRRPPLARLAATATASSAFPGRGPERLLDDDSETEWFAAKGKTSAWIQLDFGCDKKITSVAWTWWAKSMADEWLLESKSTGDETWTLRRSSVRDGVSAAPSDFNAEAELEGWPEEPSRWVRLTMQKGHLDPWNFGVFFGLRSFTATGRDDFAADGARAAWPGALRGAAPGLWFALEHPRARCEVDGAARRLSPEEPEVWRLARCTLRLAERVAGNAHANHAVHGGIEEYLEEVRGWPFGQILHYNSWYDLRSPSCDAADRRCFAHEMGEKNCADRLKVFNGNLSHWTAEHHLDAFLLDDGWDNPDSLWEVDDARFPEGFAPLVRHAKQMGTRLGVALLRRSGGGDDTVKVWMSPFGGYGAAGARRVRFGAAKGFERSKRGSFALAGPKYFQNFQAKVKQRISEGFGIFKFDGLGGGLGQSGGEEDRNDFEAMLSLLEAPSERDGSRKREANRFQGISF